MTPEQIIIATAWHEAAHSLAFSYYGIPNDPQVFVPQEQVVAGAPALAGACVAEGPVTPWQGAVVGWAGVLGQCLAGHSYEWMPPYKPTATKLRDFHSAVLCRLWNLSLEDQKLIRGCYGRSWSACRFAFKILSRDRKHLRALAHDHAKPRLKELAAANTPAPSERKMDCAARAATLEAYLAGHPEDVALYKDALALLKQGIEPPERMFPKPATSPDASQPISPPEFGGATQKEKETT